MRVVLMYSLAPPSQAHLERLSGLAPELDVVVAENEAQALAATGKAEVILGHRFLRQCLPGAKRLLWVQTSAQGVDRLPLAELAERGVMLTRSTLDAQTVATHAVALAWALARALPESWRHQVDESWDQRLTFAPLPKKALVMGFGAIGRSIALRLHAQGIEVTCGKRADTPAATDTPCERILSGGRWRDVLADTDWCFLALPHTPETSQIFDESAMRSLPSHAVLVNVGRGETLDTAALLRVLEQGHLAGVGLDVAQPEPLPPGHPLWQAPRVVITPHVASHHPERNDRVERYFEEQVARYLAAEPLADVVDLHAIITAQGNGEGQA